MWGTRVALGLFSIGIALTTAMAAPPRIAGVKAVTRNILKLEQDYVVPVDSVLKKGDVVSVQVQTGKLYEDLEINEVQPGKTPATFRGVTFRPSKGTPSKLAPNTMMTITTAEDHVYDVVTDPAAKAWVLLDREKRDQIASERLAGKRQRLWPTPTDEEKQAAMKHWDELAEKVRAAFPTQNFVRQETQFFVVYTDMPPAQIAGYVANLDSMYHQLCTLFSIPKDTNIWVGKCPVFCFLNREHFAQFEAQFMGNAETQGVAGLNHQYGDGKVMTSVHRGNDPIFFAAVLVHETAHGFLHRIRSSGRIPPWMNEGISEWIAQVVVPQSDHVANRFATALPQLRATGSLGGDFLDESGRLESWQYGVAATLTQFLLATDANAYRALITAIKEGYSWEEALDVTYGITPAELAVAYGRSVGVPNLRP